jgi:outer membrane protein assembly factor BamD
VFGNVLPAIFAAMSRIQQCLSLLFLGLIMASSGCGDYQKVLKSTDPELKWTRAQEYFADDRCIQSLPLLQELIGLFRGTERMEDVYFMYAEAHLCVEDWYMGRYTMRNFAKTFPNSARSEEAEFRAALCSFRLSPGPELDQSETQVAMDELQLFLDRYPTTILKDSCNNMIAGLRGKLETKAWRSAELYHTTGKYQSAAKALAQFITEWPISKYAEDAQFLILKSQFLYAEQSTTRRQAERYADAIESYFTFAARFPESALLREAEQFHRKSRTGLDRATEEAQ